jgi:transcription elongation factor SPT5
LQARPAKRRKKARRNIFIDNEAEVDEEDEEEDEGDDDAVEDVHPDDLLEPTGAELDDRHHRELDMRREVNDQRDVEELAREIDERYRRRAVQSAHRGGAGAVPLALPTVNDPMIWMCKCRPGKEREVIMMIQKRIDDKLRVNQPINVYSAFERGPTGPQSGYLYVEADTQQAMVDIIEGVNHVFMGSGQTAISVKERPDLLRKKKRAPLEVGKFVRMLRPPTYKGDLAKVVEVSTNGLDCSVQIVPRLDYGLNEDTNAAADNKRKRGFFGRGAERPPAKLFSETEAKKRHMKHLNMTGSGGLRSYTYKGEDYQNGFLIKDVKVNWVTTERVNPKMEELQYFTTTNADGTESLDLPAVQAAQKATTSRFTLANRRAFVVRLSLSLVTSSHCE